MAMAWMSPMVTSAVRLVVITILFIANCGAAYRTYTRPKYRGGLSYKWITILTILMLNFIYLSVIWAPFTITTIMYSAQDLHTKPAANGVRQVQIPSTYVLEFMHKRNGSLVRETKLGRVLEKTASGELILPEGAGPQDLITIRFDQLRNFQNHLPSPPPARHSKLGDSLNLWITRIQDLVTSSYTYSLILIAVMRKILSEKGVMVGGLQVFIFSFLLAVVPIPLTLMTKGLANITHQFAIHTSEISESDYTVYSIICDVNITQNYVVGLFLECTVVVLVAVILLVVTQKRIKHSLTKPEEVKSDLLQMEEVASKFVLVLGAGWAWPFKPILVTILFCLHGPHWSNVVCWMANMVVAIPVVFIPLTVFLPEESDSCTDYDIFSSDPENTEASSKKHAHFTETEEENEAKDISCELRVEGERVLPAGLADVTPDDAPGKGSQARENLKFYLGTDILKPKKEDEICILGKSSLESDDESVV